MNKIIKKLLRRTPLGWLQLSHQKGRLVLAIAGVAFADILMFMQLGFQDALYDSNTLLNRSLDTDIVLLSPQARNMQNLSTFSRRRLYQAMDVPGVTKVEPLYGSLVTWKNPQTQIKTSIQVIGLNPEKSILKLPEVNQQLDRLQLPDYFLFDQAARGDYQEVIAQIKQGKRVTTEIGRRTITVNGLFTLGASFGADGTLIASNETFLQLFPDRGAGSISLGLIQIELGSDPQHIAAALKAHLPNDIQVMTHEEFVAFEENYWKVETASGSIFGFGVFMGFLVGIILVYQVLSNNVNAHLREYATFKAIGYQNLYLLGIIFEEAIILAILGFVPSVAVALHFYKVVGKASNLPLYMPIARALLVFILTATMSVISGTISTFKLQGADPADLF